MEARVRRQRRGADPLAHAARDGDRAARRAADGAAARARAAARVETLSLAALPASRLRVVDRHRDPSAARAAALDEAEIAVGVGLGIGGPEALPVIEALAAALGGAPIATTRDVVDKGWLPRQHQVGITGRAIAPRFYFAIGIRGASEHMVGRAPLRAPSSSIDRNPQAPIFAQADLGIVADWAEAVPRLTQALRGCAPAPNSSSPAKGGVLGFASWRQPKRRATYDDLLQVPEWKVAEIIDGELIVTPRPATPHAHAGTRDRGRSMGLVQRAAG